MRLRLPLLVLLLGGGFAGLRRAEIERLAWNEINFERGHIEVAADEAKTATRRLIPIHPNLKQWLAPWRGSEGRLFSSRRADGQSRTGEGEPGAGDSH